MRTNDEESRIALMLSSFRDQANHAVPILDTFVDATDETISYLVMPFLRLVDDPAFESIREILDFADQILEVSEGLSLSNFDVLICCPQGLVFMHSKGVAHR
jgi:serine/threonine protein kinase